MFDGWMRLFPLVFGSVALIASARELARARTLRRTGGRARGTVVDQHGSPLSADSFDLVHAPVVEFTTDEGKRVRTRSSMSKSHSVFVPGRPVSVVYDRRDPSKIVIVGYEGKAAETAVAIAVAVTLVGAAIALWPVLGLPVDSKTLTSVLVPAGVLTLGLIIAGIGFNGVYGVLRTRLGPRATGTVVGESTSQSQENMTLRHAVVRWTAPTGEVFEAPTGRGRLWRRHEVGQEVTVYQHPADPHRILLRGDGPQPVYVIFLLSGLFFTTLGALIGFITLTQ